MLPIFCWLFSVGSRGGLNTLASLHTHLKMMVLTLVSLRSHTKKKGYPPSPPPKKKKTKKQHKKSPTFRHSPKPCAFVQVRHERCCAEPQTIPRFGSQRQRQQTRLEHSLVLRPKLSGMSWNEPSGPPRNQQFDGQKKTHSLSTSKKMGVSQIWEPPKKPGFASGFALNPHQKTWTLKKRPPLNQSENTIGTGWCHR